MEIAFVEGDIVRAAVDAVVNAANSSLLGGGGVDGALLAAGGPAQLAGRRRLRATDWPDGLPPGRAAASEAGELPARWVIHVVGPVYSPTEDRSELLTSCYTEALAVADRLGAASVAFPAVSAGAYGWPLDDAARIAVAAVAGATSAVQHVRFVLYHRAAYDAFTRAWAARRAGPDPPAAPAG